jgi:5,10-methylenetetrahydrofolate reductase
MFLSVEQTVSQTLPRSVVDSADEITITHLPNHSLYKSITTVRQIQETNPNAKIVPHIAARNLHSDRELIETCEQFKKEGLETVLVIGGNLKQGRFYQSVYELCRTIKDLELTQLCGVYPQQESYEFVKAKKYPSFSGGITQFCLNTKLLNKFHTRTRIGVPSMCAPTDLYKYMKRCGVFASVKTAVANLGGIRYINQKGFDTCRFVSHINSNSFHIYNFGKIEKTVASLREIS